MRDAATELLIYTLHVGNYYGTERMAMATLEGLSEYRRIVLAPPSTASPSLLDMAAARHFEVRSVVRPLDVLLALLPIFVRHRRIDVISTSAIHNLICLWLGRFLFVRVRQINVVHGGSDERYSYAKKRVLNKTPVGVIAVSAFVQRRLAAHAVAAGKVTVIENFLADADARARPRRPPFDAARPGARSLDSARVRVIVVSRLDPFKRLDVLLEAVAGGGLAAFDFAVYGTGELLEPLRAEALVGGGHVVFHGYEPDVASRLAEADLFVHLCPDEPFGLVVLEAFAAGLPVIVPDAGGSGEIVDDGVSGIKYAPADANALVAALHRAAATSGDRLDAMVCSGRDALAGRFSAEAGTEAYRRALHRAGHG